MLTITTNNRNFIERIAATLTRNGYRSNFQQVAHSYLEPTFYVETVRNVVRVFDNINGRLLAWMYYSTTNDAVNVNFAQAA